MATAPADADQSVIPEVPADLPHNQRHGVGRKGGAPRRIKTADGFYHADGADLHEILHVCPPVAEPHRDAPHQSGVVDYQLFQRRLVPGACPQQQFPVAGKAPGAVLLRDCLPHLRLRYASACFRHALRLPFSRSARVMYARLRCAPARTGGGAW